jgi:hypothetical protein
LLALYYPCEHWVHLRTTNPIESTFATVNHRTKVTKGPRSRSAGLAMAFKLIESAQARWRAVNAPISPLWCAPARGSRTASSSNDPVNYEVISKPRDQGGHEAGRYVGQRELPGQVRLLGGWADRWTQTCRVGR